MKGFGGQRKDKNKTRKSDKKTELSKEQIINQAFKFHSEGNISEAAKYYQYFINQGFNDCRVFSNYGLILKDMGRLKEAELSTRKAIELNPNFANAHSNLGIILKDFGKLQEAELSTRKAIELNPNFAMANSNLGYILMKLGQLQEALRFTLRAIELNPNYPLVYLNMGEILKDLGELKEAELSLRKAIEIKPDFAEAHCNLGGIYKDLGKLEEAELSLRKAIEIKPDFVEAHCNLGGIYKDLGKLKEAELSFRKAIEIKPDNPTVHMNLGGIYKSLGNFDQGLAIYKRGNEISPMNPNLYAAANLFFQDIYQDTQHILKARSNYANGIKKIELNISKLDTPKTNIFTDMFWLPYQNMRNDKEILVKLGKTMQDLYKISESNINQLHTLRESKNNRICIGICSDFLSTHTIGKLYKGLIHAFQQREIDITILRGPSAKYDNLSEEIDSYAVNSIRLPSLIIKAVKIIRKEKFDALFYPDIGMSSYTYTLALHRLAPIQVTSYGHPNTTGLNTIDYFISSELIEPINAQELYEEQLIKLRKLPCIYTKPNTKNLCDLRKKFQIPDNKTLIGIPQNLFKFHPDYDDVLEQIIEKLPNAKYIIIDGFNELQTERLKKRWEHKAPETLKNSLFLRRISQEDYLNLLDTVDLLLDPIYFGSGNTFYEAMAIGTPLVTMPGNYMRGRGVAGGYKQMKLKNAPVARNIQEYIELAIKFSKNPELRIQMKKEIKSAAEQYLFEDQEAANEIIEFFQAAVEENRRTGGLLPLGWQPSIQQK